MKDDFNCLTEERSKNVFVKDCQDPNQEVAKASFIASLVHGYCH